MIWILPYTLPYETIDENYLPLLKIPLIAGRNFSPAFPSDSTQSVIVNESFVKAAIGKIQLEKRYRCWETVMKHIM